MLKNLARSLGQWSPIDKFWKKYLVPRIQGMITRRILLFHDALVRRGQIQDHEPERNHSEESINRCTAD